WTARCLWRVCPQLQAAPAWPTATAAAVAPARLTARAARAAVARTVAVALRRVVRPHIAMVLAVAVRSAAVVSWRWHVCMWMWVRMWRRGRQEGVRVLPLRDQVK